MANTEGELIPAPDVNAPAPVIQNTERQEQYRQTALARLAEIDADPLMFLWKVANSKLPCRFCDDKNQVTKPQWAMLSGTQIQFKDLNEFALMDKTDKLPCPRCMATGLEDTKIETRVSAAEKMLKRLMPNISAVKYEELQPMMERLVKRMNAARSLQEYQTMEGELSADDEANAKDDIDLRALRERNDISSLLPPAPSPPKGYVGPLFDDEPAPKASKTSRDGKGEALKDAKIKDRGEPSASAFLAKLRRDLESAVPEIEETRVDPQDDDIERFWSQ